MKLTCDCHSLMVSNVESVERREERLRKRTERDRLTVEERGKTDE